MAVFEISLDVSKTSVVPKAVRARVGDSESCVVKATVTRSGAEYDLTGKGVRFECMLPDGSLVRDAGVEVDGSTIEYAVPAEILRSPGIVKVCYFRIFEGTEVIDSTETLSLDVKPGLDPCSLEVPGDYLPELDEALASMRLQSGGAAESAAAASGAAKAANDAASSATAAASAATSAAKTAGSAAKGASSAAQEASSAATSATSAASSATAAASAALKAAEEATEAAGMVSQDKTIFLSYDTVGDVSYLTLTDESED